MDLQRASQPFVDRPKTSAVLALLLVAIGLAFACGWIPESPNRRYFPGHQWLMAALNWLTALFFLVCSFIGFKKKNQ